MGAAVKALGFPTRRSEQMWIRKNVLLHTLDVRQIRRKVLGKRKASGMKSNPAILQDR
jgi:hypothetical protein